MYRFLKWIAWITSISFVFIIVGIIAVKVFISSDEVIRIAEREGRKILGRRVSIARLDLGLFKIKASDVIIEAKREKVGTKSQPFVRFRDVEVALNPSTLIYRHLSIVQLTIRGVSARIKRDVNGKFNFQDIIKSLNRPGKKTNLAQANNIKIPFSFQASAEATESGTQNVGTGFSFTIHELDLHDVTGEFRFDAGDAMPALDISCSFTHIEVDKIQRSKPLDIFFDGKCQKPGDLQLIQLQGDAHINADRQNYRASLVVPLFDLSSVASMAPKSQVYRLRKGTLGGYLKFAYVVGNPIVWDVDLKGRSVHVDFQTNRQAKWQNLVLPELKLKTKGQYDPLTSSAHIESFLIETPFVSVKMTKPSFWNVSAKDEVHMAAHISNISEVRGWVSRIFGMPIQVLKKGATTKLAISAKRDRRVLDNAVAIEVASQFVPVEWTPAGEFVPFTHNVSKIEGTISGRAHTVFVFGRRVQWDVDLKARAVSARLRVEKGRRWERVQLKESAIRSKGSFDIQNESVQISVLEIELPFARSELRKPAQWDVSGDGQIVFSVDVRDLSSAMDLLERIGTVSLEDVPKDAKIHFDVAVARNRKTSLLLKADVNARFHSLPIASLASLFPFPSYLKKPTGQVEGALQVSFMPNGVVRWNADLTGKKVGVRVKIISNGRSRDAYVDVNLGSGREKLKILLSGTRGRRKGLGFSYKASASFAPIQVSPLAELVRLPPSLRNLRGAIAGEVEFVYVPEKKVAWSLEFTSDHLSAEFFAPMAQKWSALRMRKSSVRTAGSYSFQDQSVRLRYFNLFLPFGRIQMSEPIHWSPNGVDSGRFKWTITSLEGATPWLRGFLGAPLSQFLMKGSASGLVAISRSGDRMQSISTRWSVAADLKSLVYVNYPNFNVSGSIVGQVGDDVIKIRIPEIKVNDLGRPHAEPDVILQGLRASFRRAPLMQGEIRASNIQMKTLRVRYLYDTKRKSNFDSLLQALNEERSLPMRRGGSRKATPPKKLSTPPIRSQAKRASRQSQGIRGKTSEPLLPVIKIEKFKIEKMKFHFEELLAKNKPPIVLQIPDSRILMTSFDTRMAPNLREAHLEIKTLQGSPSVFAKATLNPSFVPPDIEGVLNLSRFDLRKISPYARDMRGDSLSASLIRGTEITKGKLNFHSTYSLRNKHLKLKGSAKIVGLRLRPDERASLPDLVKKAVRASLLRLFEKRNDTISLNVQVEGRLDDPDFHLLNAVVEPMFANLFEQIERLLGDAKNILTGILGPAIEGVQKVVPGLGSEGTTSGRKEHTLGKKQVEKLGKALEDTLKKGLRSLFGVKSSK